ncbi:MAG TPA: DinB family protein [Acidimicrobiales bacterium]|jgi:uncharacterized damage-inducible protein DinB|nr:DinB family protein [Acidimicrobiales bacterium]
MTARVDPPLTDLGERDMLRAWLEYHRDTLLMKCDGLTPAQLGLRSVEPSTMSLQGLVRHMTEVERNWFLRVFAGVTAPPIYYNDDDPDGDFDNLDPDEVDDEMAMFHETLERCREVEAAAATLEENGAVHASHGRGPVSLRWIMIHMVEEYARHNGHADLLRERIDGITGD